MGSLFDQNLCPLSATFSLQNRKKSQLDLDLVTKEGGQGVQTVTHGNL